MDSIIKGYNDKAEKTKKGSFYKYYDRISIL